MVEIDQGNEEEVENVKHLQIDRWTPEKKVIRKAHLEAQVSQKVRKKIVVLW